MKAGLCAVLFSYDLQKEISFVNLYAPYLDREYFWTNLVKMEVFLSPFLVLGAILIFPWVSQKFGGSKLRLIL